MGERTTWGMQKIMSSMYKAARNLQNVNYVSWFKNVTNLRVQPT